MSDFTFVSTTVCEYCGNHKSSSDAVCNHDGKAVEMHVFRPVIGGGIEKSVGVRATMEYKWHVLSQEYEDIWTEYEYVGPLSTVNNLLSTRRYSTIDELPQMESPFDAPSDVSESA